MTFDDFCVMNNYTSSSNNCIDSNGTIVPIDGRHFNFKTPSEDFWNINILGLDVTGISFNKAFVYARDMMYDI